MQQKSLASLDLSRIRVRGASLVTMQLIKEETSPSSTRLVLLTKLVTGQLKVEDTLTGSARLVLPLLPAMELHTPLIWLKMASHLDPKSLRVSRTVYVIRVQVHLMMQVSLTSVVTNWNLLENC